jgi:di/tricarboxylate transporter
MTVEIFLVLSLVVTAMVVFTFEWLPVDVTTLLILVALVLTGILSPGEAFAGFASEIIVILASIFVISGALVRTGVMSWLGHFIDRQLGKSENKIVLFIMTLSASLSAFINNTNATAVLMPAALDLSKRNEIGMLQRLGFEPYSLFEFSIVGIVVVVVGILYFSIVGYRFLPETAVASLSEKYEIEAYLSSLLVPEDSSLIDQTLEEAPFSELGLTVLAIERAGERLLPRSDSVIGAGDVLVVHGDREALFKAKESPDLHIETDTTLGEEVLAAEDAKLVEAIVMPSSSLAQRNLKQLRFRQRFGASVLGIYRREHGLASGIRDLPLRVGDVILLQGSTARLNALQDRRDVWLLGEVEHVPIRPRRGVIAVLALTTAIVLSATELLPLSVALLLAGLVVVLARCIPAQEIYTLIEWRSTRLDRWDDRRRRRHGEDRRRRAGGWRDRPARAPIRALLRARRAGDSDDRPHATAIQLRFCAGRSSDRAIDGRSAGAQSADVRSHGHARGIALVHHAVRAVVAVGLRARRVPLSRLRQGGPGYDRDRAGDLDGARASRLAAVIEASRPYRQFAKYGARRSLKTATGWAPTTRRPLTKNIGVASTPTRSPSA